MRPLADYTRQADALHSALQANDPTIPITLDDARLALARSLDFLDWSALAELTAAPPEVHRFEDAVDAAIAGDAPTLARLLREDPALVHRRSTRRTHFDPPVHAATLLHYLAANGTERPRQVTPPNAVDIARLLLAAGAHPDALANFYGGPATTMTLLVSSTPPAEAGLQVPLLETLLDHGASPTLHQPLFTALAFSFPAAAETLVARGAPVDTLPLAAGLGRAALAAELLPHASPADRHRALSLAAQLGHAPIVALLLDAGEDPDRFNLKGLHAHSTPLHQAALAGHLDVVDLLLRRGARPDIPDTIYHATPLGWARHANRESVAKRLEKP